MITAGIDCGARNTKTVIMKDGRIIGRASVPTGFDQRKAAGDSFGKALESSGVPREDVERIAGTGSGKDSITMADAEVNDIEAMARAVHYYFPNVRTATDVGAEDARVVKIDEKGVVIDFAVNEKCAAGAGVFVEAMARALEVELADMGPMALESGKEIPMNAQCAVFAESEVVSLIHAKTDKCDISKSIHDAMARRIVSLIRRVGIYEDVAMIGGVGYNPGFLDAMRRELKLDGIQVPQYPEYGAAVGAALVAAEDS